MSNKIYRLINYTNLPLLLFLFFLLFIIAFNLKIVLHAPFATGDDDVVYLGIAQKIIDKGGIVYSQSPDLYYFTPFLFLLIDALSLLCNNSIVIAAVILIFMQFILAASLFFLLCNRLLKNQWLSLITTILFITHGDQLIYEQYNLASFPLLRTGQFSFIIFLLCFYLSLIYFQRHKVKILALSLFISPAIVLYHHQSGIENWLMFYIFLLIMLFVQNKKRFFIALFIAFVPLLIFILLNFYWQGKLVATVIDLFSTTLTGGISEDLNILAIDYFQLLGGVVLAGGILGMIYLLKYKKKHLPALFFLSAALIIILFGTYQLLFGLHFFPRRFLSSLHFPAEILCGFFLFYLWRHKKKILLVFSIATIVICGLSNYFYYLNKVQFDLNWQYITATEWAKKNLDKNKKFASDVSTIVQFDNLSGLQPAFDYPRVKDYQQLNSREEIQKIFVEKDALAANEYLKKNKIRYVIIDTKNSPFWTPGNYEKFNNTVYFTKIFSQRINDNQEIIIYQTI